MIRQEYLKAALNQDFGYFDVHKNAEIANKMNRYGLLSTKTEIMKLLFEQTNYIY